MKPITVIMDMQLGRSERKLLHTVRHLSTRSRLIDAALTSTGIYGTELDYRALTRQSATLPHNFVSCVLAIILDVVQTYCPN
jgi:hypothetical protein